jgi:hypothetical protein
MAEFQVAKGSGRTGSLVAGGCSGGETSGAGTPPDKRRMAVGRAVRQKKQMSIEKWDGRWMRAETKLERLFGDDQGPSRLCLAVV